MILLDPGHGGQARGKVTHGFDEATLNLTTCWLIREHLESFGYAVEMTREGDTYVPHSARGQISSSLRPEAVVSVHHNAAESKSLKGPVVFWQGYDDLGRALVRNIPGTKVFQTHGAPHWTKRADRVLREHQGFHRALVECCYLTNRHDRECLRAGYTQQIAEFVAAGIVEYMSEKEGRSHG